MGKTLDLQIESPYKGCTFILTTKHAKSLALADSLREKLGAGLLEYLVDTDVFGTFTGEVERKDSALECARKKCELCLQNTKGDYALGSEGSFGPHPSLPFLALDQEILYFIDRKREIELYVMESSTKTNYQMSEISSYLELIAFGEKALFPSHGLIVRPYPRGKKGVIRDGITSLEQLKSAYDEVSKTSGANKIWVETDMRAQFNPNRMECIQKAGEKLADRLSKTCPKCKTPGWGIVETKRGLPCKDCSYQTGAVSGEIHGCCKCSYREEIAIEKIREADPSMCPVCNP